MGHNNPKHNKEHVERERKHKARETRPKQETGDGSGKSGGWPWWAWAILFLILGALIAYIAFGLLTGNWFSIQGRSSQPCCGTVTTNVTETFNVNDNRSFSVGGIGYIGYQISPYLKNYIRENNLNSTLELTNHMVAAGLNASKYLNYSGVDLWRVGGPLGVMNATYLNVSLDGQVLATPKGSEYIVAGVVVWILYENLTLHSSITLNLINNLNALLTDAVTLINCAPDAWWVNCSQSVEFAFKGANAAESIFGTDWIMDMDVNGDAQEFDGTPDFTP